MASWSMSMLRSDALFCGRSFLLVWLAGIVDHLRWPLSQASKAFLFTPAQSADTPCSCFAAQSTLPSCHSPTAALPLDHPRVSTHAENVSCIRDDVETVATRCD